MPFSKDVLEDLDEYKNIDKMLGLGADWVSIVPYWHQDNYSATIIHPNFEESASDKGIIEFIQYLHSKNIQIMLKPHVDSIDETWRAEFDPTNWSEWFETYQNFINHYAEMAEDEDIELFCIGCEYTSSDSTHYNEWKETILGIRNIYSGDLVYAADWSNYNDVCFWDLIDYVGIDGYFPLYEGGDPDLSDLISGWENALEEIEEWRKDEDLTDKQILITEVGYESQPECWKSPGFTGSDELDLNAQNMCYKALFSTVPLKPWIEGMFIWWWDNPTTHDYGGGLGDNGWTPKGKPAEITISWYYTFNANLELLLILFVSSLCCIIGLTIIGIIYKKKSHN